MYWEAITQIEAQEILVKLRVADWPNMKSSDRSKWHRELHKMAYPVVHSKEITTQDLASLIFAKG